MAITTTLLTSGSDGWDTPSDSGFVSAAITPGANCVLVLLIAAVHDSNGQEILFGTASPAHSVVSSGSGPSWTKQGFGSPTIGFTYQAVVWRATIGGTDPGTFTVTADWASTFLSGGYAYSIHRCTGHDTTTPFGGWVATAEQAGDGAVGPLSMTAAPTVNDVTVALSAADTDPGQGGGATFEAIGGTWTETAEGTVAHDINWNTGYRTGSTFLTIGWADVKLGGGTAYTSAQAAIVVKASAAPGPVDLTVAAANHAHAATTIDLSGSTPLVVANAENLHAADTISLSSTPPAGFSDNFNRADTTAAGVGLGTSWVTNGAWYISSNHATKETGDHWARWATSVGNPNHYSEADISSISPPGAFVNVTVRNDATGQTNMYYAFLDPDGANIELAKVVAGVDTTLQRTALAHGNSGGRLRLEAIGTTLRVLYNSATVITFTDASLSGSYVGIGAFSAATGQINVDNWQAGIVTDSLVIGATTHAQFADTLSFGGGGPTTITVADANHGHSAQSLNLAGFPYPVTTSNRKLLDTSGRVYLLKTFSSWSMSQNLTNAQITQALEAVAAKGFNAVTVSPFGVRMNASFDPRYQNIAGQNFFTGSPYVTNAAGSGFGPAWSSMDWVLSEATRLSLTVVFSHFMSWADTGTAPDLIAAGNTNAFNYGQAVATRYAAYRNIVWHVMGDDNWDYGGGPTLQLDQIFRGQLLVEQAQGISPRLIVAEGQNGRTGYSQFISQQGTSPSGYQWFRLSCNHIYNYGVNVADQFDTVYSEAGSTAYPVWDCEPPYAASPNFSGNSRQQLRERLYATLIRNGVGINYGDEDWWPFGDDGLFSGGLEWFEVPTSRPETSDAQRCWTIVDAYCADATWVPDNNILVAGMGTGDNRAAAGRSDRAILAYFPSSRTPVTINTSLIAGTGLVRLRWYDPSNGTFTTIAASEAQSPSRSVTIPSGTHPDGSNDWVLIVETIDLVVADANHAQTATTISLGSNTLTVADANHAHAADNLDLVQNYVLVVANATHASSSTTITLSGTTAALTVADGNHLLVSTTITLAQTSTLVVQAATHLLRSTTIDMTGGGEAVPPGSVVIDAGGVTRTTTVDVSRAGPTINVVIPPTAS